MIRVIQIYNTLINSGIISHKYHYFIFIKKCSKINNTLSIFHAKFTEFEQDLKQYIHYINIIVIKLSPKTNNIASILHDKLTSFEKNTQLLI